MIKIKSLAISIITLLIISSCNCYKGVPSVGSKTVSIFKKQHIQFIPNAKDSLAKVKDVSFYTDGRIVMKKVSLPKYQRDVTISAKAILKSNGDRWDKSGSFFVIPAESKNNLLEVLNGKQKFPESKELYEDLKGIAPLKDYKPAVEIMRFMTPFGVGYYSEKAKRKPVYIPLWEKQVTWEEDVTQLASRLQGDVYIGVWLDTWTPQGYVVNFSLEYQESEGPAHSQKKTQCEPLLNTIYYLGEQGYPDIFARKDIVVDFQLPEDTKNATLYYTVTGHGGHDGGDEFVKKENIISHNGKEIHRFIPWRDDCASFRRFNPTSGVWLEKDTASYLDFKERRYKQKVIEERIASSDYSRSNWCPGSDVPPVKIPLGKLIKGKHQFTFSIPKAQAKKGDELNHWLVSAYLVWEK